MSARDEGGAYARIRENLSELGLDAMAAGLPHWMSAVAAGEADFASAMLAMTSEEAEAKRRRGTDRKVRAAGFPFVKTLADFDFSFQPSIPRAVVDDLAALRFLDAAENVVLVGSPGVGKTHIAVALGVEAVRARKEVRFTDCAALVRDLKDASSRGILAKRLKYYAHATLLIIDELGYLDVDEEGADLLFQLVSARYEHRSTVITTNVAVGLWADVFGDGHRRPGVPPLHDAQDNGAVLPHEGPAGRGGRRRRAAREGAVVRAADAAGWLAAFGAEDVAVTVRFPQLGGWEVTSWAVAPGDAEGSPALEVEIWAADFDYPAVERALGGGPR